MRFHHFGDGRYAVRLDPGEEVITALTEFAEDQKIFAGHVTGLGATADCTLGFFDPDQGEYVKRTFDEPMEVAQLTGTFSKAGDKPFVHVHAVLAPRELLAYGGHIVEARVGVVMELFVTRFDEVFERRPVEGLPFPFLFLPGEPPPEADAPDAT